jgi:hypothetical protein
MLVVLQFMESVFVEVCKAEGDNMFLKTWRLNKPM